MRCLFTLILLLIPSIALAGPWGLVTGGKADQEIVVCKIPVKPGDPAEKVTALQLPDQSVVPTQLVVDHSLNVDVGGMEPDAMDRNMEIERRMKYREISDLIWKTVDFSGWRNQAL